MNYYILFVFDTDSNVVYASFLEIQILTYFHKVKDIRLKQNFRRGFEFVDFFWLNGAFVTDPLDLNEKLLMMNHD